MPDQTGPAYTQGAMGALLRAVRDQLRAAPNLGLRDADCEIMDMGQPSPRAGDWFVAPWYGYFRDFNSNGLSLEEELGVNVTVSRRLSKLPLDRWGPDEIAKQGIGLTAFCEKVRAVIHMDPTATISPGAGVMARANAIIGSTATNGFYSPLSFLDVGRPERKSGRWWGAKGKSGLAGLAQTVSFGGAKRVQVIEYQT